MVKLSSWAARGLFIGALLTMSLGAGRAFKSMATPDWPLALWGMCTAAWALIAIRLLYLCEELLASSRAKSQRIVELREMYRKASDKKGGE